MNRLSDIAIKLAIACALTAIPKTYAESNWTPKEWPVLKHYDANHLYRIALPLGGIGTGTVSLGGRGELCDWEIMNVPAKGYSTVTTGNNAPFFAIHIDEEGKEPVTALLEGPLYSQEYLHYDGRPANHHGFPRFSTASFDAAYPFGQVNLSDPSLPVKVRIKGFNPLVPADADASGWPVAVLSYEVTNCSEKPIVASICGALRNFIGRDGSVYSLNWKGDYVPGGENKNVNAFRSDGNLKGIYMYSEGVDSLNPAWGTIALATPGGSEISYRTDMAADDWNNAILDFWDDFSSNGIMDSSAKPSNENDPMCALASRRLIRPGATETFTFYIAWNFPNRKAWAAQPVGNYYSCKHGNAWEIVKNFADSVDTLETRTLAFVNSFLVSTYPPEVKEAALFNLATLRSQTVFRLPSGHLMGWEGVMDRFGSCYGSCTHVWNYEVATPFLFGELAKTMREVEFRYSVNDQGLMNFRAALPLSEANKGTAAAADGQMGAIMKAYREWNMSGDTEFLKALWPNIRKSVEFAWRERGWDANKDGVMEGAQHNTMDVDYYGPNPQMGFWYLGALRAASRMAKAVGDDGFSHECDAVFNSGSAWIDANLFNGEYYEHKIANPATFEILADDAKDIPPFQLGKGCLVDQLVGQYMAHLCGLGYLADKRNISTTMNSIMKYNYVKDFSRHFNNMRSYVMGNESGLVMASWPKGRLAVPFPYFAEVMTGFEYCAATEMIYEGMTDDALRCIKSVRDRHDGAKRNPFSEPECGHHYARSMASWSAIPALSGFLYSAVDKKIQFTDTPGVYFWSNGYAWGNCTITDSDASLKVIEGNLEISDIHIGSKKFASPVKRLNASRELTLTL